MNGHAGLLLFALAAVIGLVLLIARFKMNAFVALILAAVAVGLGAGMPLSAIARAVQDGVGGVLGSVAVVVGLGTILGKMLAESGGARVVSETIARALGERRVHWTMMLVGFVVGIPVFFSVGLVLLMPIAFTIARVTRRPLMVIGIPLMAGLSVVHGLVPPHPGPMVAIEIFKADVGTTIFYSLLIGFPTAVVAGPLIGPFLARRVRAEAAGALADQLSQQGRTDALPGFGVTLVTILLPVLLMLCATIADVTLPPDDGLRRWVDFVGSPVVALLLAVLLSFYTFGVARGYTRDEILKFTNDCVAPIAGILLVVGAGGGFNRVLVESGVGQAIAAVATASHVPVVVLGWLVAALIRIATGSATVAITTAAGIMAPIAAAASGVHVELLVLAMGAGSLIFSHVNDAGFWLVKECFNLTVQDTLRTWTAMETVLSVVALVCIVLLDLIV
ncbi:MAG: permease DsdX [Acidobacteria bacterium]|nr:permease DsdX [Acidobacteriota bacterium]